MDKILYAKDLEIKKNVDVLVIGGGCAGVAAAIAAAQGGVKVLLLESQTALGGLGTLGLVPVFQTFDDGLKFLAGGVGKLIYERMRKRNILRPDLTFACEKAKILFEDLLIEFGVEFRYCSTVIDVIAENKTLTTVIVNSKSGIYGIKAKVFIDCTGDGDVSAMAGAEYLKGDDEGGMMAGTLCSIWNNVDFNRFDHTEQEGKIEEAYNDGIFTVKDKHLPGMFDARNNLALGNLGHEFGVDGTDEESLTKAFVSQRKKMQEYEKYYNNYISGFEKANLVATASMFGIRETRRIVGDYILNVEDFKKRATFEDEIGRYCYAIDVHETKPSEEENEQFKKEYYQTYRYKQGESYGIPYRSIIVKGLKNLLVAGRCISCDRLMLGSIRVMPGCFITGQAAGAAASIAVNYDNDIRAFDFGLLKNRLEELNEVK